MNFHEVNNTPVRKQPYKRWVIFLLLLIVLVWVISSGVKGRQETLTAPDPYILRVNGISLRIPASYLQASDVSHPRYRKEASQKATSTPGWSVSNIRMILDIETMAGMSEAATHPPSARRYLTLWLPYTGSWPQNADLPLPVEWVRSNRFDMFGLKAFQHQAVRQLMNTDVERADRTFIASATVKNFPIVCSGFGLPNPICEVRSRWMGIAFMYRYDYTDLNRAEEIHSKITQKLDSFFVTN